MAIGDNNCTENFTGPYNVCVNKRAKGSIAKKAKAYLQAVKDSQEPKGEYTINLFDFSLDIIFSCRFCVRIQESFIVKRFYYL